MTTETMSVHKALCELKILDDRITKAINERPFVFANKHSNAKVSGIPIGEYCEEIKAAFQSASDLIHRRDAIKRAVILSNATTTVTIAGVSYTVAEAIDMKGSGVLLRSKLFHKLESDSRNARLLADRQNGDALEVRADNYIQSLCGSSDMKNLSEELKKLRAEFVTAQTVEVVDPLTSKEVLEKLKAEIDSFTTDVDAALSVSNALTQITIEY